MDGASAGTLNLHGRLHDAVDLEIQRQIGNVAVEANERARRRIGDNAGRGAGRNRRTVAEADNPRYRRACIEQRPQVFVADLARIEVDIDGHLTRIRHAGEEGHFLVVKASRGDLRLATAETCDAGRAANLHDLIAVRVLENHVKLSAFSYNSHSSFLV